MKVLPFVAAAGLYSANLAQSQENTMLGIPELVQTIQDRTFPSTITYEHAEVTENAHGHMYRFESIDEYDVSVKMRVDEDSLQPEKLDISLRAPNLETMFVSIAFAEGVAQHVDFYMNGESFLSTPDHFAILLSHYTSLSKQDITRRTLSIAGVMARDAYENGERQIDSDSNVSYVLQKGDWEISLRDNLEKGNFSSEDLLFISNGEYLVTYYALQGHPTFSWFNPLAKQDYSDFTALLQQYAKKEE